MKAKYKELTDIAFRLQKQNMFDKALEIYQTLLNINPEDVNVLNLVGMLYMSKKDYEESINYLSKAMVLNPSAYIVSNLAKAYYFNKQYQNAIDLYLKALEIEPNDDIYYSLGLAYKAMNNLEEALKYYNKALKFNSNNYNANYNIAVLYKDLNNSRIAIDFCLKARELNPDDVDLYTLLSKLYENIEDYNNAIKYLEIAIKLTPNEYVFYYNIAVLYSKIGDTNKSIINYLKVLEFTPNDEQTLVNIAHLYRETDKNLALSYALKAYGVKPESLNVVLALSQVYRDLFDNEKSLQILNEYLSKNNSNHEIYYQIALNKMDICEYSEAMEYYNKALSIDSDNLSYLKGKAIAHKYLGEDDVALKMLKEIYQKDGKANSTAVSLGMCYLKNKDFNTGMELYSKRSEDTKFLKLFNEKIWNKSVDIVGKKVLLYSDCGLGDTIMFARYLPVLSEITSSIAVQTDKEIVPLLRESYPNIIFISKTEERPEYDVVMPIMDISYALNSDFYSIPYKDGYLIADDSKIKAFKQMEIFNNNSLKVGICYQGNKRVLKNRSIDIEELKDLFSIQNAVFYSFQLNSKIEGAIDLSEYINDYSDTASLLKCIDVLVTIDSSIVHVAGGLGINTYLMLPKTPEWRWFDDEDKSSWYNSVKIFKQSIANDWSDVINNIKNELLYNG